MTERMARLNILMEDDLAKKLRIRAVEIYGGEKGGLSQAISEAVELWLEKAPSKMKLKKRGTWHQLCSS